ncbi:MAG: FtsH protease activity modulator HflK [Bacteriovoracaceae bacterium]
MSKQPNPFDQMKTNLKATGATIALILVAIMAYSSFYTVEPDEQAVVIRLGKYHTTNGSGLHFKMPFNLDKVIKVKVTRVLQEEFGFRTLSTRSQRTKYSNRDYNDESLMLTGDLNVADVEWVVQYRISNPFNYLFKTKERTKNIRDVSESIMRRVVGDRSVSEVLTYGRVEIETQAKELVQEVLDKYEMGIRIQSVKLQDVNPPEVVKDSFNEVNEAKQEQEKAINQAEKGYNSIIPEARGKAQKQIQEAQAYSTALVNRSLGDAEKFTAILKEYRKAPSITRKRIYIETMEEVFTKINDITIVDPKVKGLLPIYQNQISGGSR